MENLISIDDLIRNAKKMGVSFGKSDPYNRLRYYTKMSFLPHMERRQTKNGRIKAFYPQSSLERLVKIESLKTKGFSNDEILKDLEKETYSLRPLLVRLVTKTNVSIAVVILVVGIVLLNQKGLISLGKESNSSGLDRKDSQALIIADSGAGVVRAGMRSTFVRTAKVSALSQVEVTFKDSYLPATSYQVETIVPKEGFVLSLDNQTALNSKFSWWIVEK